MRFRSVAEAWAQSVPEGAAPAVFAMLVLATRVEVRSM